MIDVRMTWSGDLSISSTGDLATSGDAALGTERVLRRLMTNPGDYVWNPEYGAGLGQFVGHPVDPSTIEALTRAQMLLETAVSSVPEPVVTIRTDTTGQLSLRIQYADAGTAEATALAISLPG